MGKMILRQVYGIAGGSRYTGSERRRIPVDNPDEKDRAGNSSDNRGQRQVVYGRAVPADLFRLRGMLLRMRVRFPEC